MADNKDDGLIELDLGTPEPTKKGADKKVVDAGDIPGVDEVLEGLKRQLAEKDSRLAEADAGRAAAEATARRAVDTATRAQTDVRSTNLSMVVNAIETTKREAEILEANLANAMSQGDFQASAKIQRMLAGNEAKLVQLETGKEAMDAEAKQPIRRMEVPTDPVEALASQLSPRSASWVRAHPEYARDPRLQQRMMAAHNLAITGESPLAPDTDAYFEHVEGTLGLRKAAEDDNVEVLSEASSATQRRAAPPSAPVSRTGRGDGKQPNRVTLTKEEVEIAEMNGMTPREYAEQKMKLQKEGRLN